MNVITPATELDRAAHLLADLRARGLYLEPRGPDRLRIGPPDRLDEDTLAHVRALKPALLAILMDRGRRTWPCIRCENPAFVFPLPTICYWCRRTEGRPGHA